MSAGRTRTFTHKGMANFEERLKGFESKLEKYWRDVEAVFKHNADLSSDCDKLKLKTVKLQVVESFNKYDNVATEYQRYLQSSRVEESKQPLDKLLVLMTERRTITNKFIDKLRDFKNYENSSVSSRSTAKLQAAKARASFAEKEAELERRKAEIAEQEAVSAAAAFRKRANLETELKLLEQRKELALVEAEFQDIERSDFNSVLDVPVVDPQIKTAEFVQNSMYKSSLNPNADNFIPYDAKKDVVSDFTKFLLRKDILTSRLSVFSDKPETYQSWKSTFKSVVQEIGASEAEEIDLLIKWLGYSSKKQALCLKSAYIDNPNEGLSKIWDRLDERFGSPENTYYAIVKKLESFPKLTIKDSFKLYDLSDILSEIEGLKEDPRFSTTLSYFDSAVGVIPIIGKLPHNIQEKWTTKAAEYKRRYKVPFPPFSFVAEFVREQSKIRNDPSFFIESLNVKNSQSQQVRERREVSVKKTEVELKCPIHKSPHSLEKCRVFKGMSLPEKRKVLRENKLCFKCLSRNHMARECNAQIKCNVCSSISHCTAMHVDFTTESAAENYGRKSTEPDGGERETFTKHYSEKNVVSACTEICQNASFTGKSCAKIILANMYTVDNPDKVIKCYVMLDEQSNRSLVKSDVFSLLDIQSDMYEYVLKSCSGKVVTSGRRASKCVVESLDGSVRYMLPTLLECTEIPDDKHEICTPENARYYDHLQKIADCLPEFDENADILLLIGRDVTEAHHIVDQVIGPSGEPYAQRLGLGWAVIGELCLNQIHVKDVVNVHKTYILNDGRTSLFQPCECSPMSVQDPIFVKTPDDDKVSLSMDDREFLSIMNDQFQKAPDGSWVAPLPLRSLRPKLPNNRVQAVKRTNTVIKSLKKDPVKKQHFFAFMSNLFSKGHAERAPDMSHNEECWYLPIFGIYHPKKPNQVRVVFDSSALFEGISLNSVLLQGPDLTNRLLGILMRFRKDKVAVMCDIEQMFYSFRVLEKHRNLLRFLWFEGNDPSLPLVEYRMCKHVFGNSPSPAIATYGLRKSVERSDEDVQDFVKSDFM